MRTLLGLNFTMGNTPLNSLLSYQNDNLCLRYQKDYPSAKMKAKTALRELMKYFWLCKQHEMDRKQFPRNLDLQFKCVMHQEMADIDNMWHTFLLFTRDYHSFCANHFDGKFIHHNPATNNNDSISNEKYALELNHYLNYIHHNLGEKTLKLWFLYK